MNRHFTSENFMVLHGKYKLIQDDFTSAYLQKSPLNFELQNKNQFVIFINRSDKKIGFAKSLFKISK